MRDDDATPANGVALLVFLEPATFAAWTHYADTQGEEPATLARRLIRLHLRSVATEGER